MQSALQHSHARRQKQNKHDFRPPEPLLLPLATQLNTMTLIRPIEARDEAAFRQLWDAYNVFYVREVPEAATAQTIKRLLDPNVALYAAVAEETEGENKGKLIGFITYLPHMYTGTLADVMYLHDLFVDPNVRNNGLGRKLMEHVFDAAEKAGHARVYWHTQHYNHRAQLLYTKVGSKSDFVQYVVPLPREKNGQEQGAPEAQAAEPAQNGAQAAESAQNGAPAPAATPAAAQSGAQAQNGA